MAKNKNMTAYILIGVLLIGAFGYFTQWTFNPSNFAAPSALPGATNPPGQVVNPAGQATVTKPIKFVGLDELAGGVLDGTTNALKVYDTDGSTLLETLTFSSGSVTSANSYSSGKVLWCMYYYDTTIDAYKWWQVTVPTMSQADAESLTTNSIQLKTREAAAYTDSLIGSTGVTITDGSGLNTTGSGNDTQTFTYTVFTTSDNTGYPSFHDPIYNEDFKNMIWVTLSGTGYDTVTLTGFDGSFERASTKYYYKAVADNDVSKYKVGNTYVYAGVCSISFGFNAAGFSNSTTSYPTMQIDLVEYSSFNYMNVQGSYGPYHFHGAEQTMLIYDI